MIVKISVNSTSVIGLIAESWIFFQYDSYYIACLYIKGDKVFLPMVMDTEGIKVKLFNNLSKHSYQLIV